MKSTRGGSHESQLLREQLNFLPSDQNYLLSDHWDCEVLKNILGGLRTDSISCFPFLLRHLDKLLPPKVT